MNGIDAVATLIVVGAVANGRDVTRARARADRRVLEQNISGGLGQPASRPAAPTAPAPGRRPAAAPAARLPQRVPAAPAPAPPRPAPITVTGPRAAGPRWAANAFIAAEVFGAPVADRPGGPGGTLGPPNAF